MKKISLKFAVGFLALVIGIAVVWVSGVYKVLISTPVNLSTSTTETSAQQQPIRGKSGKVLIHSKEFEYGKGWNANFEIVNETPQPIFYVGSKRKDKFDYCTLAVKHEEPFPANHDGIIDNLSLNIRDSCYYSTGMFLQTLEPGDSIILAVWENEVRNLRHITDAQSDTKAQIGFEFFVGADKRREIVWSEEITFPYDEYR